MTQVESGKEEGAQPTKCEPQGSDSGPSSHTEETIGKKLKAPKTGASAAKKAAELKIGSPNLTQRPESVVRNTMKTLKVYRNGEHQDPQEFQLQQDLKYSRSWSAVLEVLSQAVSSKFTAEGFSVAKVFTTQGKRVLSASDLESCDEIVVCGSEPYQTLPYGSSFGSCANNRRFIGKASKVRRSDRDAIVKSVIYEPASAAVEMGQTNRKNPMVKTFSEQDVSNIENSPMCESMSPKLRPRSTHSPKPRPVSAYHHTASAHGDRRSPMGGPVSRIPKRIIATAINNNRGSTPNVAAVNSVNNAITNNNMNNRNCSQRRTPEAKVSSSERPSRQDTSRREFIRPRLVTIIRHGMKPRRAVRFLLNKKTARSYDQVLTDVTESIKPDWGAVRRVYTLNGAEVATLEDFFGAEDIFLACANDRVNPEDFELDFEECKAIQPYVKATLVHKHARTTRGLDSKSPQRKSGKGTTTNAPNPPSSSGTSHPKNIPLSHFPSPILDKYEVGDIIGDGNFAVVRDCTDRKTKSRYALKVIDKSKCNGRDVPPEHEILILTKVSHPNIIVLYEQYDFSNELYVVMELVEGGDLFDAIADVTKFSEKDSKSMTKDIASALDYLHTRQIVHRDIKPENLLVYFQNDGQRRIKLGDFGLAQIAIGPMYTVCGTPTYVAPEILAETGYGLKVDIWALGVIVYVLLCGYPPFVSSTGDQEDLFDMILSGDFEFHHEHWETVSSDAKDIISRMIEADSDARLTADEVLQHPWLAANSEEREARRRQMFQRDFRLTVFEAMGLSTLNPAP
ncbi:unnamed protein product [Orchesella dallaii]|uniref:non-specific serine/threonine protein kinase n=1 Tax=Orchesella dallaii TaxID=48710 RepID=A0ABP1QYH2_9HEXA